jgi:hypothetical protein
VTTGTQPVYDAALTAQFFDAAGQLLTTTIITPALQATLPGQHNRFIYQTSEDPERGAARTGVIISSWRMTSTIDYQPITVVSATGSVSQFLGEVHGIVRNDQPRALTGIVILSEIDGIGSSYKTTTISRLEPGATASFSLQYAYPSTSVPEGATQPVVQGIGQLEP